MKRLSKEHERQKALNVEALNKAAEAVRAAVAAVNAEIGAKLNPAIDAYNAALSDAEQFKDEIAGEMDSYMDDRSDNWRNGDAGQTYDSWKSEWEGFDATELGSIEEIEEPEMDHADNLEQLQHEPA